MEAHHQEITNYNNNIQLATPPRGLIKQKARDGKLHSSVILCFKTKQEADGVIKKGLLIRAVQTRGAAYRYTQPNSQCNACQGYGHHSTVCRTKIRCQLCAGEHNTRLHTCTTCQTTGKPCCNTIFKCANCQGPQRSNTATCETLIDINKASKDTKTTTKPATTSHPNTSA